MIYFVWLTTQSFCLFSQGRGDTFFGVNNVKIDLRELLNQHQGKVERLIDFAEHSSNKKVPFKKNSTQTSLGTNFLIEHNRRKEVKIFYKDSLILSINKKWKKLIVVETYDWDIHLTYEYSIFGVLKKVKVRDNNQTNGCTFFIKKNQKSCYPDKFIRKTSKNIEESIIYYKKLLILYSLS